MPVPQPTTVRHDGEFADRSVARVPRCTPTSLNHAVNAVDPSKLRRPGPWDTSGVRQLRTNDRYHLSSPNRAAKGIIASA